MTGFRCRRRDPRVLNLLVSVVLLLVAAASPIAAQAPLRLVTLEYPPYQWLEDGAVRGESIQILEEVLGDLGVAFQVEVLPWPRALQLVRSGEADGIFTAFRTPEREEFLDYCNEPLIEQSISLFVLRGMSGSWNGEWASWQDRRIGVVPGVSYGATFDTAVREKQVRVVDGAASGLANLQALLAGRVDAIVSNRASALFDLERLSRSDEVVEVEPPIERIPSFLAFSKKAGHADLRNQVDQELRGRKAASDGSDS